MFCRRKSVFHHDLSDKTTIREMRPYLVSRKPALNVQEPPQLTADEMRVGTVGSAIVSRERSTEETSIDHCTGENSGRGSRICRRRRPSLCSARVNPPPPTEAVLQNVAPPSDHAEDLADIEYCFAVARF